MNEAPKGSWSLPGSGNVQGLNHHSGYPLNGHRVRRQLAGERHNCGINQTCLRCAQLCRNQCGVPRTSAPHSCHCTLAPCNPPQRMMGEVLIYLQGGRGLTLDSKKTQAVWCGGSRNEIPALLRREAIGYNLRGQGSTQGYPSTPQGRPLTPALRWPFHSMFHTFQTRSNMNLTALVPLRQGVRESGCSEAPITAVTDTHRV